MAQDKKATDKSTNNSFVYYLNRINPIATSSTVWSSSTELFSPSFSSSTFPRAVDYSALSLPLRIVLRI